MYKAAEIYRKVDNQFEKVGYEFSGFPSNGLWFVQDGKQNCIIPMGDKPVIPDKILVSYMVYQEELMNHISEIWENKSLSTIDIARVACEFFAIKAGGMKVHDTIIEN